MPDRLLHPRGGFLLPLLHRRSPELPRLLRSTSSKKRPGTLLFSSIHGFSGMAAGSPEKQLRTVELTDKEEQIFRLLLDVVRHFGLGTQLRVAGGWVRDKLLGKGSVDIDIALDNMTGQDFCKKVNEYSELIWEEQKKFHVSKRNPDQSKHLETAGILILVTLFTECILSLHIFEICVIERF